MSHSRALSLPQTHDVLPTLLSITDALGVPRTVLAQDHQIKKAWRDLPDLLNTIPPVLRDESMAKMCVAVSVGLFDSALNYAWNGSVLELRQKIRRFGIHVVQQVIDKKDFDEEKLLDLKDSELLTLCLKLNLVSEEGYGLLDQCRELRNNFSAAHPAAGLLDDYEFLNFLNRCAKYALSEEPNPIGVDLVALIGVAKGNQMLPDQRLVWKTRIQSTHDAQRTLIYGTLHGIYCDPAVSETARQNSIALVGEFVSQLTPKARSLLLNRHSDYAASGSLTHERYKASQQFFEKLGLMSMLGEHERHALFSNACTKLLSVHQGTDNFYNEPPFAQRLLELSRQDKVPETARYEFIATVVTCAIGNSYGTSNAAYPFYSSMVVSFSPAEIDVMLSLPEIDPLVKHRVQSNSRCKSAYSRLVSMLNAESVPAKAKVTFEKWRNK